MEKLNRDLIIYIRYLQRRREELQAKLLLWSGVAILSSLAALAILLMRW